MNSAIRHCRECGNAYTVTLGGKGRERGVFCSRECGKVFANRAMLRGQQVYHLFRNLRRHRSEAKRLGVWTAMCQLETMWEDDDRAAGRKTKSYKPASEELAYLFETRDLRPTTNVGILKVQDMTGRTASNNPPPRYLTRPNSPFGPRVQHD